MSKSKKVVALVITSSALLLSVGATNVVSHCEIPCGAGEASHHARAA